MFYYLLAILVVLIGLAALYFALRLLGNSQWLMGFVRGLTGLALVLAGAVLVLVAVDMLGYKQILTEKPLATISFERLGPQSYRAILVESDGREQRFDLAGDQWQLDARVLRWNNLLAGLGAKPAYRLDRLGGRYYSLEKERQGQRTVYPLDQHSTLGMDLWPLLESSGDWLPLQAKYGSATYMPMEDGALYAVSLTSTGLAAAPLNERAQEAVNRWK